MAKISLRNYNREIESMLDRGQTQEVVAHCLHILKTHPKYLETYRLLGKAYLEQKKYGDAVDIFSRILVCVPNDFVAHVGMSIIRDEEKKLDDAIWHMERAFETQPSNAAVQSELQRLYGRRDGVQPPRIRMTRGALAQMYVKGELFPQAISEIKSVLKEDPGRTDMQALLARTHFRSGQKNEAVEVAGSLLRRYPYCLDANAVLAEILGSERPENAQIYRQHVIELDPYAAHAPRSILDSSEAPDSAIALEKLNWDGQPSEMDLDWRNRQAIRLEDGFGGPDTTTRPQLAPASSDDDIPDFLRAAGWGASTGAFDESRASLSHDETIPPVTNDQLSAGDLPDWVQAMKPAEPAQTPSDDSGEVMPDWMSRIDPGILPSSTESPSMDEQPDWMKGLGATNDQPDWLKQTDTEHKPAATDIPASDFDFLNAVTDQPQETTSSSPPSEISMTDLPEVTGKEQDDAFAWLESLAAKQGASEGLLINPEDRLEQEPDWVKNAKNLGQASQPIEQPSDAAIKNVASSIEEIGNTGKEQDDAFAWLESLAAKQGATEGLLVKPEDRLESEPDWIKQAKDIGEPEQPASTPADLNNVADTDDWLRGLDQEDKAVVESASDDTAAWLQSLDAPEKSAEPSAATDTATWLKSLDEEEPQPKAVTPLVDDTAMWLKSLDEPDEEEKSLDLPAWMKNVDAEKSSFEPESTFPAKEAEIQNLSADRETIDESPGAKDLPGWLSGLDQEMQRSNSSQDDLPAWLRDETGEVVAEPTKIEPTRADDWQPVVKDVKPAEKPKPAPKPKKSAQKKTEGSTRKGAGDQVDPILGTARAELSRSNIPGALETYAKLIKKGRFLDEVVFDLREALYRYPVEVSIWQSLGDAYMRANRLQDALDSYTKAEELLR